MNIAFIYTQSLYLLSHAIEYIYVNGPSAAPGRLTNPPENWCQESVKQMQVRLPLPPVKMKMATGKSSCHYNENNYG
jgi:hypothetical protein